jgi:hypothetical protein
VLAAGFESSVRGEIEIGGFQIGLVAALALPLDDRLDVAEIADIGGEREAGGEYEMYRQSQL